VTKVLVTGGAGFIGSHTVDALLGRGYDVRVVDALLPPVHNGRWPGYVPAKVERIIADTRDKAAMGSALDGVAVIYHFAAYQDYLMDFSTFFHVNATATALLYELIVERHLPVELVIVASSQAVYGEGKYRCASCGVVYPDQRPESQLAKGQWEVRCPACDGPLTMERTDEATVRPHNSYAMSKRSQEEIALNLGRRYGIPSVAFRYSIVQGPRQSFHNAYSGALRSFAVRVLHGRAPVVYEDGLQQRDYVSVDDVVRANLLPLDRPDMAFAAYNVGGDRSLTVQDLAELVAREAGADVRPHLPGSYRFGDTRHVRSDVSRLGAFGWRPHVAQELMVREYLAWARQQPDLADTYEQAERRMRDTGVLRDVAR